jgi:S1-C subfamily serine protease
MKRVLFVISILMIFMLACQMTGFTTLAQPTPVLQNQTTPPALPPPADPSEMETTLEALYQQVLPGVVAIRTQNSLGSGFVFDSEGHVVTNQRATARRRWLFGFSAGTVIALRRDCR